MATLELPDDVVRVLLKEFQVDPEEGGAIDAAARLKLLVLVLGKLQAMSHVVARFGSASQLDPAALPQLKSRKLCTEHFNKNALFSVQETVFRDDENKYGIWFELRQLLNAFVTGYVEQDISRLQMRAAGTAGEGLIAIVGARQAGELPLLELRCQFFTGPVPQAFAAAEAAMRPSEELMLVQKLQRGTLKLAGALLQANTAVLSEQYIDAQHAAWGPAGEQFSVSCLLPIQPLKGAVKLHRCCKVCGARGDVMSCSRCKEVSYCSKDCQRQDWKRHKAECTAAAAAAGTSASSSAAAEGGSSSSSSRPSVVVKLHEQHDMARFPIETVWNVQTPVKHMLKANEKGPQWKDGHAPAVQRPADASKQFLVKIQAALDGPPGHRLLLYDEKRKVLTHVAKSDQARGTYDQLLAVIRTKGYLKAKLYFNAVLEEERQLRVLLDPLPSQTHPW
uniref:MYND-type domain-containing protein n=1 Tax=Tetradesmus obliquus TaxID=3088 RepID=A0A383WQF5_TETOB|eukprot:jgi/Sobl393_1/8946/SZX79356.1